MSVSPPVYFWRSFCTSKSSETEEEEEEEEEEKDIADTYKGWLQRD